MVEALMFLGFLPGTDFNAFANLRTGERTLEWLSSKPQPTQAEIDAATLPAAIAQATRRIKDDRDRRKVLGCPVGSHVFHSDADSRIQQMGLVMMGASMPAGIMWRTVGGAYVEMTPTLAGQIFQAQAQRDMQLFVAAEAHIAAVSALPTAEAVLAYDYSTGWPA